MICFDATIAVKWFKPKEKFEDEALKFLDLITDFEIDAVANEWISLEVVRGLKRAQLKGELKVTDKIIDDAFRSVEDLFLSGAVRKVSVESVKELAKDIEINLNLYAADSVHLATGIYSASRFFVTADEHHLKTSVKNYVKNLGIEIVELDEFFRQRRG